MGPENNRQTTEVQEVRNTDNGTVRRDTVQRNADTAPASTIVQRIVWYIAGVIIALLALRIVLLLLAANRDNPFVSFIYDISSFFAWPFFGIFNYQPAYGQSVFELSSVVAIIVYALIAWGIAKLFTLTSNRADA